MNVVAPMKSLVAVMAENPSAVIEDVAREHGVTPRAVLEAMPKSLVRFTDNGDVFAPAMQDIAQWGDVTLIIHTDDGIFEITDPVAHGEISRSYYNLSKPKGLHGHLRYGRCGGLAFVQREFRGNFSAFIAFLNVDGGIMFKVFVGRDEARALRSDQLVRFRALAETCGAR